MSPLLPIIPAAEPPNVSGINRQFVVLENGHWALRDGGPPAAAHGVVEVTGVLSTGANADVIPVDNVDLSDGIDYARWERVVQPASREGFADANDFLDLFDED